MLRAEREAEQTAGDTPALPNCTISAVSRREGRRLRRSLQVPQRNLFPRSGPDSSKLCFHGRRATNGAKFQLKG